MEAPNDSESQEAQRRKELAKQRLRAALAGVELDPDETADDLAIRRSTLDSQLVEDIPPHHGRI